MEGKSKKEICRDLTKAQIPTVKGGVWHHTNITNILKNITYTGQLLLQKVYIQNPITKKVMKNTGEFPQYLLEENHAAIIDQETFDEVKNELERRKEFRKYGDRSMNARALTDTIKCPHCGCDYKYINHPKSTPSEYWMCSTKRSGKSKNPCMVKGIINHIILLKACEEVLGLEELDPDVFTEKVDHIEVPETHTLVFYLKNGETITKMCKSTGHKDSWTAERRAKQSEFMKKESIRRKQVTNNGKSDNHSSHSQSIQPDTQQ